MTLADMLSLLWQRTPYLLGGYINNLFIAITAMLIGTALGAVLGIGRHQRRRAVRTATTLLTHVCRNVPSFVLMFYIAFVLPAEFQWGDTYVQFPLWLKATMALVIPVTGFASDQTLAWLRQKQQQLDGAGATFIVAWVQYYLIVLMASATASVIGVDAVVGRANRVIAIDSSPEFLLLTYGYVCLWFLLTGLAVSRGMQTLEQAGNRRRMQRQGA